MLGVMQAKNHVGVRIQSTRNWSSDKHWIKKVNWGCCTQMDFGTCLVFFRLPGFMPNVC